MSLMSFPRQHTASSIKPMLQRRDFTVHLQCLDCEKEHSQGVPMLDEVNDTGTANDFYESGAASRIDRCCPFCNSGEVVVTGLTYVKQPGDERRPNE